MPPSKIKNPDKVPNEVMYQMKDMQAHMDQQYALVSTKLPLFLSNFSLPPCNPRPINLGWVQTAKVLLQPFNGTNPDVAPRGACRPWILFINGVFCFMKINGSGMEKEER